MESNAKWVCRVACGDTLPLTESYYILSELMFAILQLQLLFILALVVLDCPQLPSSDKLSVVFCKDLNNNSKYNVHVITINL